MDDIPLSEVLAVRQTGKDEYESVRNPEPIDLAVRNAYGGCTTGMMVHVASSTVPDALHLYSLQGIFLGPAAIDRPVRFHLRRLRDTRSFATRQVEASQLLDDGTRRTCLVALVDYMAQEKALAFQFSEKPRQDWGPPENGKTPEEIGDEYVRDGKMSRETRESLATKITPYRRLIDCRVLPGSPFGDSLCGVAPEMGTEQDHLPLSDRVSADWARPKSRQSTKTEHVAALTYLMDLTTGFIAAAHSHQHRNDFAVTGSLEFSLRFFSNDIDTNDWHLREMSARVGAEGRSFHEVRVWDTRQKLVAVMTQQAIIRPKPQKKTKI